MTGESEKRSQAGHHAALIGRVAADRDREAFTVLFDFFAPRVKGYLLRIGCSDAMAEEVTQDAMVALWHKAHLFDPAKSSPATWLFRIARNRRIDLLRRDRSHLLDPEEPMLQPQAAVPLDSAYDAIRRDETVRGALKALPEEQLGLIRLAFFENKSHSEIAEETGLPLGTVKSRIRLAFSKLRRTLEQAGHDPQDMI